jgi:16S rRNA (cytosine967-C5)-methyltransferase
MLNSFKPGWNDAIQLPLTEKLEFIKDETGISPLIQIFPWQHALSNGIDAALFNQSFLVQPELFLRIRPGKESLVLSKLAQAGASFKKMTENCLALPNSTKADSILQLDKEAVVQDYNSQKTGSFINRIGESIHLWDCCAASGGKAIMAFDLNPAIQLTVSDVRESIMHNLHQRFKVADINSFRSFVKDLTLPGASTRNDEFDIILADLPCTGSGTWARTPEQLYFFNPSKIEYYSNLQKKILANVVPRLKKGGKLVYITCSVFRDENEGVAEFIQEKFQLELKEMQVLKGYDMRADSMFVAVFRCEV